jgi:hypothetical protein
MSVIWNEKILSFEPNYNIGDFNSYTEELDMECDYPTHIGLLITTEKRKLFIGIRNEQDCCETWDQKTLMPEIPITDDLILKSFKWDTPNSCFDLKEVEDEIYLFNMEFIVTSEGVDYPIIWSAYNEHNGYYGHGVRLVEIIGDKYKILEEDCI